MDRLNDHFFIPWHLGLPGVQRLLESGRLPSLHVAAACLPTLPRAPLPAKTHYGTSLANVDWLHGSAESLLTVTNLLVGAQQRWGPAAWLQGRVHVACCTCCHVKQMGVSNMLCGLRKAPNPTTTNAAAVSSNSSTEHTTSRPLAHVALHHHARRSVGPATGDPPGRGRCSKRGTTGSWRRGCSGRITACG